jgi:PAS domain-containing protein
MLESELFTLLEGTTDAAFTVTDEGEILSWNNAAEKLFGHTRAAAVHKTCYEILEGMGPLGTRVCHEHCSVAECAGRNTEIPNFDMSVKAAPENGCGSTCLRSYSTTSAPAGGF